MTKTATKSPKGRATKPAAADRIDIYQKVTDSIVKSLEGGVRPWSRPWESKGGGPLGFGVRPLRWNGAPYTGINVVLLWAESAEKGYVSPYWLTFNQARKLGKKGVDGKLVPASVRKGEKAAFVVYASKIIKIEKDEKTGDDVKRTIAFLKQYFVFNAEQIDGLPDHYYVAKPKADETPVVEAPEAKAKRLIHADEFFRKIGADIKYGGSQAFYSPTQDFIQLPKVEDFKDTEGFYATLGHEQVHWTGHKDRLNRDFSGRFGNEAYAAEELVAELGSAFLCADLAITLEPRDDHASYIAGWLKVLKDDKRFIIRAASLGQKAVELLHELAGEPLAKYDDENPQEAAQEAA